MSDKQVIPKEIIDFVKNRIKLCEAKSEESLERVKQQSDTKLILLEANDSMLYRHLQSVFMLLDYNLSMSNTLLNVSNTLADSVGKILPAHNTLAIDVMQELDHVRKGMKNILIPIAEKLREDEERDKRVRDMYG